MLGEEATRVWLIGSFMTFLCYPQETPARSRGGQKTGRGGQRGRPDATRSKPGQHSKSVLDAMSFYHEPNVQHEDNFFRDEIDDFHDAKERVRGLFFLTISSTKTFLLSVATRRR